MNATPSWLQIYNAQTVGSGAHCRESMNHSLYGATQSLESLNVPHPSTDIIRYTLIIRSVPHNQQYF